MSNCQDRSVGPGPFTLTPSGTGKCATSGGPPSGTGSALVVVVVFTSLGAVPLGSEGNEVDADADRDGDAEVDADGDGGGDGSAFGSSVPPQPDTTTSASSEPAAAAARTARVLVTVDPPGRGNGRRRRYRTQPRATSLARPHAVRVRPHHPRVTPVRGARPSGDVRRGSGSRLGGRRRGQRGLPSVRAGCGGGRDQWRFRAPR